jgi:hypothetical protein
MLGRGHALTMALLADLGASGKVPDNGGYERVAEHVRVHPRHPDPGGGGQVFEPACGGVASMRTPRVLRRIGPSLRSPTARSMARLTAGGSGVRTTLPPLPAHPQYSVAVLFAEVVDAGAAGYEDPQSEEAEACDEGEVVGIGRQPGGGDQGLELQVAEAEGG